MAVNEAFSELSAEQEKLIYWLLRSKTKADAARAAKVPERTMFNWLNNLTFMTAYRAARRGRFDNALMLLEKGAEQAAQALMDVLGDEEADHGVKIRAAQAVLGRAFHAQEIIAAEQELERLRGMVETLKAIKTPAPVPVPTAKELAEVRMGIEHDQAAADLLRVTWMGEVGHSPEDIAYSLRYNRPSSVVEEQELLDLVRKLMDADKAQAAELAKLML